ncbi:MAG: carbohydrate ABC transporter permease [Ruthenibacterium sp.]
MVDKSLEGKMFQGITKLFLTLFGAFCTLPLVLILVVSFTEEKTILKNGYSFFPEKLSLDAYRLVFCGNPQMGRSYAISVMVTVVGTLLAVAITGMAAYALANKNVRYRNGLSLFFFITMVLNTGLVPWYMMCKNLGLYENIMALIVPKLMFNPFNLFLVINYMKGVPDSLMESAKIDGASDWTIAFRIYFPLAKPVLATVALFYGIAYWNDWFNAIMLVSNQKLFPTQYLLFALQSQIEMLKSMQSGVAMAMPPAESFKMATAVITVGPIIMLYPFLQKYFVKGLIIGSVKG